MKIVKKYGLILVLCGTVLVVVGIVSMLPMTDSIPLYPMIMIAAGTLSATAGIYLIET